MKRLFPLFLLLISFQSQAQINSQLATDLQNILNKCQSTYGVEGVEMALILPDACTWTATAGIQSPGVPISANKAWSFGSCTKAMTAAIVLQLHEEGKLNIEDPIGQYLNTDTILHVDSAIQIKQLLNHTSGLGEIWKQGTPLWNAVWGKRDSVWNLSDIFNDAFMVLPTGINTHNYANTNYMLLGFIIESATGNSLEKEFQDRLFTPLNMASSYLGVNGIVTSDLNGVYNGSNNNGGLSHNSYYSTRGGSAYLVSKPMEYARFVRAFHNGDLFDAGLVSDAQTKTAGGPSFTGAGTCLGDVAQYYGYGTEIAEFYPNATDTIRLYGHGGNGLGVSLGFHDLENNVTLVLSGNDYTAIMQTFGLYMELFCKVRSSLNANPCALSIQNLDGREKPELVKIVDILGRETTDKPNTLLIYIYSDGSTEKVYRME